MAPRWSPTPLGTRTYDAEQLRALLGRLNEAIAELEARNEAGQEEAAVNLLGELNDRDVLR